MQMNLFTKNEERWTKFKISVKEIKSIPRQILILLGEPTRKSTRYYYWEKKGDFINGKDLD